MKCEKCNHVNSEYDIICEKCGSPLNIENNVELQKKYNDKPRAIDIVKIVPDNSEKIFNDTKQRVKYFFTFLLGSSFAILIIFLIFYIRDYKSRDILVKYDNFINNSQVAVVYFGIDEDVNKKIDDYSLKYGFDYMYINTNKINVLKRKKLKNKLKLKKLESTLMVIKEKKVVDILYDCNVESNMIDSFLLKNGYISKEKGNPANELEKVENIFKTEETKFVYISNNKNDLNSEHNELIKKFCSDNDIEYVYIEGYKLSDIQKLNVLKKFNYTEIHNEFFAIFDEGEEKYTTEYVPNSYSEYTKIGTNYGILDKTNITSMEKISIDKMKSIINSNSKNIVLIVSDDCMYCERIKPIITKIAKQNNLKVYYYNVDNKNVNDLKQYLEKIDYKDSLAFPLLLITENNKVLESIVGLSDKEYYIDKFKEFGVIK